jgi:ribosomal protein L5
MMEIHTDSQFVGFETFNQPLVFQWADVNVQDFVVRNIVSNVVGTKFAPSKVILTISTGSNENQFAKGAVLLGLRTGQAPQVLLSKKSIAKYRVMKGDIGEVRVTLTGSKVYRFLKQRTLLGLPGLRDFESFQDIPSNGAWNFTIPSVASFFTLSEIFRFESLDRVRPPINVQVVSALPKLYKERVLWLERKQVELDVDAGEVVKKQQGEKNESPFYRSLGEENRLKAVKTFEREGLRRVLRSCSLPVKLGSSFGSFDGD